MEKNALWQQLSCIGADVAIFLRFHLHFTLHLEDQHNDAQFLFFLSGPNGALLVYLLQFRSWTEYRWQSSGIVTGSIKLEARNTKSASVYETKAL